MTRLNSLLCTSEVFTYEPDGTLWTMKSELWWMLLEWLADVISCESPKLTEKETLLAVTYWGRAVCSTADSPVCFSLPRPQADTSHLLLLRKGTFDAATLNLHHSFGNMATMETRGTDHLQTWPSMRATTLSCVTELWIEHVCSTSMMRNGNKCANRPRQGTGGQSFVSLSGPRQSEPLFRGGGLMQAWVRICVPWPQVTEQSDHTDHGVQPPSTGTNTQISNKRQDQEQEQANTSFF